MLSFADIQPPILQRDPTVICGMDVNAVVEEKRRVRSDVKAMDGSGELDPWTAWAYKPRTVTLLLLGACLLM